MVLVVTGAAVALTRADTGAIPSTVKQPLVTVRNEYVGTRMVSRLTRLREI